MLAPKSGTQADAIRDLIDQGLSRQAVRVMTGASRQAILDADRHRAPVGRRPLRNVRVTLYVAPQTVEWLRAEAERDGCTPGAVVDAIADRRRKRADF